VPLFTRFRRPTLPALAAAALLTSCGDDSTGSTPPTGSFTAALSGGVSGQIAGSAQFTPDLPNSGIGTAFLLRRESAGEPTGETVYLHRFSDAPLAAGTYNIISPSEEDEADFYAGLSMTAGSGLLTCTAETGSITVTSATADDVLATVSFSGNCHSVDDPEAGGAFAITMTLNAERGTFGPGSNLARCYDRECTRLRETL
jgi:hypothetical protein